MKNDLYKDIDQDTLIGIIKNARLIMYNDTDITNVLMPKSNCLFGGTDYIHHQNDDLEFAKEFLSKSVEKISFYDCKQNLNYYLDGIEFDTIVYQGYRGGYIFHIGWYNKQGKDNNNLEKSKNWNDLMMSIF